MKIMIKVCFVCHGNICRSPMAEFVLKDIVKKQGIADKFFIASAATSTEEIGNPVHRGTANILARHNISVKGKTAVQITKSDYENYDFIIIMDSFNMKNLMRIIGSDPDGKVSFLLDYANRPGESIADPWYTGDFQETYLDVCQGCNGFVNYLRENGLI